MELPQLKNLLDVYSRDGEDQFVRIIIPGPTPVSMGIMSLSPSLKDGVLYLIPDDEDVVEL